MQSAYPMRSAQPRAQGVVRLAQGVETSSSHGWHIMPRRCFPLPVLQRRVLPRTEEPEICCLGVTLMSLLYSNIQGGLSPT